MSVARHLSTASNAGRLARIGAVMACTLAMGACSGSLGDGPLDMLASSEGSHPANADAPAAPPQSDLQKATEYWAKEYAKAPQKAENAVAYAKNLKAMGRKSEAFSILQQAATLNNSSKPLAAEYGRLALEFDQTTLAAQLLEFADDPMRPDWRVISARGAALAKLGKYKDAVQHLERAQLLAPAQASVQNNLALAYAMSGEPHKAEDLLRKAVAADAGNAKTRQNLALVLGLQGKYDEATQVGATAVSADIARENTALVRQIVRLDPKVSAPAPTSVAQSPVQAPVVPVAAAGSAPAFKPAAIDNTSSGSWASTVVGAAP